MEAKRRRVPWFGAILVVLLVSYTIARLRGAADSLPYDPGDPYPVVDVDATDDAQRSQRIAATLLDRKSVRLRGAGEDGADLTVSAWPLRGIEYERALRVLGELRDELAAIPRDNRTPSDSSKLAQVAAAQTLVEQDRVFVLEQPAPLTGGDRWHYWDLRLFEKGGRRRFLYAPIDKDEFPFVRRAETADPATFEPR